MLGNLTADDVTDRFDTGVMVSAEHVWHRYAGEYVLRGVDLSVSTGEVACIFGPSGAGKSTFLRCVNHLERIEAGMLRVDGELIGYRLVGEQLFELSEKEVCRRRSRIGMVFQHFNLFAHMTALENVIEAPITVNAEPRAVAIERAMTLLERVGLKTKAGRLPKELSGGEQQRVAIARALAMRPKLLLCDEPTSALDSELVGEVLDVLRGIAAEGMTMLIVTHELNFARDVADTLFFMDAGVVVESGRPRDMLTRPERERTRTFLRTILG
jgi:polar amino acid transport system ATP-binding protein